MMNFIEIINERFPKAAALSAFGDTVTKKRQGIWQLACKQNELVCKSYEMPAFTTKYAQKTRHTHGTPGAIGTIFATKQGDHAKTMASPIVK